ncbi:MAG: glucosaminidase domain-containing protein [Candidatus Cohnella colombiensis]|uniref:Glucosaminidase domain-containing protein n=1 Tax=Candidatus Cohnella colombiensis TaxID=3121368 RepID=A0AA95EXU8_9BACL|nr:MAG: glucosaminidase domain-containing protein [Cohnella sp.]
MAKYNKQQFYNLLLPTVLLVRKEGSKLFPSVRLAQSWLETGGDIHAWNNLGGIKVGSGKTNNYWHGQWANKATWEVESDVKENITAQFRAYASIYDYYKDQDMLLDLPRYERVRLATTPQQQATALRLCGYATDPQYDVQIVAIIRGDQLLKYDQEVEEHPLPPSNDESFRSVAIHVNGVQVAEGQLIDNRTWVPARVVSQALGLSVAWNGNMVFVEGHELPTLLKGDMGFVPIRELTALQPKAKLEWKQTNYSVEITL